MNPTLLYRCDNGHYWDVTADENIAELWRVVGEWGEFDYAGVDTSVCPTCMARMGLGWDTSFAMPIAPLPLVGVTV